MSYVSVGATIRGARANSKKALREALAADPAAVVFDPTSVFDTPDPIRGDAIPAGVKLSVVGPDPYRDRRWYAIVERVNGKIKLS